MAYCDINNAAAAKLQTEANRKRMEALEHLAGKGRKRGRYVGSFDPGRSSTDQAPAAPAIARPPTPPPAPGSIPSKAGSWRPIPTPPVPGHVDPKAGAFAHGEGLGRGKGSGGGRGDRSRTPRPVLNPPPPRAPHGGAPAASSSSASTPAPPPAQRDWREKATFEEEWREYQVHRQWRDSVAWRGKGKGGRGSYTGSTSGRGKGAWASSTGAPSDVSWTGAGSAQRSDQSTWTDQEWAAWQARRWEGKGRGDW